MEIDLLSVGSFAGSQPHDQFDWLREHSPIHRHAEPDGPGFWAVTRHADVKLVGRDHERFSSHPTIMIDDGDSSGLTGDHTMMLTADPPLHTRMRRLVSRRFTPRAVDALRPRIDELADQIVGAVIGREGCDLVTDLAGEMPSFMVAELLGLDLDEGRQLYHLTEALHSSEEVVSSDDRSAALMQMFERSQVVYHERVATPTDDLASLIANGEVDGQPVDSIDFFLWFLLLVDAGGDTTRNLVGAGFAALFDEPDQLAVLASIVAAGDRAALLRAIDELLRWTSPVIYMRRTATQACEIAGQSIEAGDKVVMYYGAANRDPEVFADSHTLDLSRAPNPHVAFGGGGPHYCMGAHLARLEIEALVRAMMQGLPGLTQTADATWMPSNFIFGPTSLPVSFTTS